MASNITDITVLGGKDLTIPIKNVNKKDIPKYWERDYIKLCINNIHNHEHKILFQFLWYSGVRISEATGLIKNKIDFENYTITLKWLKNRKYNERIIPMHPNLKELLQLYTATMNMSQRVFPITRQRAWQLTKKYFTGHPHQLRHSYAVNWLRCGGDIVSLHRILGHSNIQTTMEYLKIVPNDLGKEMVKIQF